MVEYFDNSPTIGSRAYQIWLILISKASNRQTLTYGGLAEIMGFEGAGTLAQFLNPVMMYCQINGLPALTVLVVNQTTGLPGQGLIEADLNADREVVYARDWFAMVPPSPEELRAATQQHV